MHFHHMAILTCVAFLEDSSREEPFRVKVMYPPCVEFLVDEPIGRGVHLSNGSTGDNSN